MEDILCILLGGKRMDTPKNPAATRIVGSVASLKEKRHFEKRKEKEYDKALSLQQHWSVISGGRGCLKKTPEPL